MLIDIQTVSLPSFCKQCYCEYFCECALGLMLTFRSVDHSWATEDTHLNKLPWLFTSMAAPTYTPTCNSRPRQCQIVSDLWNAAKMMDEKSFLNWICVCSLPIKVRDLCIYQLGMQVSSYTNCLSIADELSVKLNFWIWQNAYLKTWNQNQIWTAQATCDLCIMALCN